MLQIAEEIAVENVDQGDKAPVHAGGNGEVGKGAVKDVGEGKNAEVIDEPDFQPEANQVEVDQIGEPPQPNLQLYKFNGIKTQALEIHMLE